MEALSIFGLPFIKHKTIVKPDGADGGDITKANACRFPEGIAVHFIKRVGEAAYINKTSQFERIKQLIL